MFPLGDLIGLSLFQIDTCRSDIARSCVAPASPMHDDKFNNIDSNSRGRSLLTRFAEDTRIVSAE
jgi:hypothetical protein